jgi:uncharacterized membrane protein YfcA
MDIFLQCLAVGFAAQLIDGALGMAYGVVSTTFLLTLGIPPAPASASVHIAEVFTTAVSGLSHLKLGNVDRRVLWRLLVPGMAGGVLGAYVLTHLPGDRIKPYVAVYLAILGVVILYKARRNTAPREVRTHLVGLGLAGGFCDAIGGGGWGPIVTSTLVARGKAPRFSIGTVNLAEFFVTVAQSLTFLLTIGMGSGRVIGGLLLGGVLAAPVAAWACQRTPTRTMMVLVGILVIALSARTLLLALH